MFKKPFRNFFSVESLAFVGLIWGCAFLFSGCVNEVEKTVEVSPANFEINKEKKTSNKIPEKAADLGEEHEKVEIIFAGDMMFDRYIRSVIERKGFAFVFENIDSELLGTSFVVANLEGPITDNASVSAGSELETPENFVFTFPKKTAQGLSSHNISVANIGNNHIMNFGSEGLAQTKSALFKANVKYFGDPQNPKFRSYVKEINGLEVGLVCFNQFWQNGLQNALDDIELLKKDVDVLIVYAHWGVEYEVEQNQFQKETARKLIDAGVDAIFGSHPHVVQGTEQYKGKKIYYSLGNFVFDQYFEKNTQEGLLVKMTIDSKDNLAFEEIPIELTTNGQTRLLNSNQKNK